MSRIADLVEAARGGGMLAAEELRREVLRSLDAGESGRREIRAFLGTAGPRAWIAFDAAMRDGDERPARKPWWKRAWGALVPGTGQADVVVTGVASMDRNGRVREAAIRQLAEETDPLVGPILALRTTDWVDPVATLAVSILSERLRSDRAVLIAAAPLLFALLDRRRRQSGVERMVLDRAAADADIRSALLASPDRQTRRRVIGDGAVRRAATLDELTTLARSDSDIVVVSTAGVEAVARIRLTPAAGETLARLLTGPALVRRSVLDALPGGAEESAVAARHLFDRSPTVRAAAQRLVHRSGGDPAAAYRSALARSERVPIAVTELARVGSVVDHAVILEALRSVDVGTRRAAAGAVRWIAGERLCELLSPLLWDVSRGVTRAAERGLRARASDLDGTLLLALVAAPRSHNRRAAFRLMRKRTAPERLEADFIALADEDELARQEARSDVESWLHRAAASAHRGDLATRRRLSQLLERVEHRLSREAVVHLRFHAALRPQDLER